MLAISFEIIKLLYPFRKTTKNSLVKSYYRMRNNLLLRIQKI